VSASEQGRFFSSKPEGPGLVDKGIVENFATKKSEGLSYMAFKTFNSNENG